MATDATRLLAELRQYHEALGLHIATLKVRRQELEQSFAALWSEYEGEGAEEFRGHWQKTSGWFDEYTEKTGKLERYLDDKITVLKRMERV